MIQNNKSYQQLIQKLDEFIRKYYINQLIRGSLYTFGLVLAIFLAFNALEYYFYFSTGVRKVFYYSFLSNLSNAYKEALSELDVKLEKFTWQAYDIEDWKKDIKSRIKQVSVNEKKDKLKKLEMRLDSIVSPEQRREMELKAIMQEMDDVNKK